MTQDNTPKEKALTIEDLENFKKKTLDAIKLFNPTMLDAVDNLFAIESQINKLNKK